MGAIYTADVWCDGCADKIKEDIASDLWDNRQNAVCPDGTNVNEFASCAALHNYLCGMDERDYDSGEFPKYCDEDDESDCPEHCAGGPNCENPTVLSDGYKVGKFFGNNLTGDGANYVKEMVDDDLLDGNMDSVAVMLWMPYYDYLNYVGQCDTCGCYSHLTDYLCDSCNDSEGEYIYDDVEECMTSGEHLSDCDDDGCCNLCGYDDPIDL